MAWLLRKRKSAFEDGWNCIQMFQGRGTFVNEKCADAPNIASAPPGPCSKTARQNNKRSSKFYKLKLIDRGIF
jgi:hypothetical protein